MSYDQICTAITNIRDNMAVIRLNEYSDNSEAWLSINTMGMGDMSLIILNAEQLDDFEKALKVAREHMALKHGGDWE